MQLPVAVINPSPRLTKWIFTRIFPQPVAKEIKTVKELVAAMAAEATREAERHGRASALWGAIHIVLGLPAAILGAVAGAIVLASPKWTVPAAVMAIAAAALAAGVTFLGDEGRQRRARKLHAAWNTFEADCLHALVSISEGEEESDTAKSLAKELIEARRKIVAEGIG